MKPLDIESTAKPVMHGARRIPGAKPGDTFCELWPLVRRHFPGLEPHKRRLLLAEFAAVRFGGLVLVNEEIALATIDRLKRATSAEPSANESKAGHEVEAAE